MSERSPSIHRWRSALRRDNLRMAGKLAVIACAMAGFGYALVPMYNAICSALGINVLSRVAQSVPAARSGSAASTQIDRSRTVTVEFDANARGIWEFHPERRSIEVHPGELTTVVYEFRNSQNRTMAAQAIPSYLPKQAEPHFNKLECFCFNQYTMQPGERRTWPVVFVIDPKLPKDVRTITLSYTFLEVGGVVKEPQAGTRS